MKDPAFLFYPNDWNTQNTYDSNYMELPPDPGVYLLVLREFNIQTNKIKHTVMYVGSTDNLYQRCKYHPVKSKILEDIDQKNISDVACYFKVCDDYRVQEKKLIKQTQARYNKQWR